MSIFGFLIVDNYFSCNKKRVTFCDEVKEYDGASDFNRNFARLCNIFFSPKNKSRKITNSFGMIDFLNEDLELNIITPRLFIEQCLEELKIIKTKLLDLKRQEKILQIANELYSFKKFLNKMNEDDEDDEYWNHEFWRIRSNKINNGLKKIALLRKGCRDFNLCLSVCHSTQLDKLIEILNDTIEWY